MARPSSKRLVIDASVLQAAGKTEHPVSTACRETLETIRKVCHRVACSASLQAEWRRHTSRFSTAWLAAMTNKKKMIPVNDDERWRDLSHTLDTLGLDASTLAEARKHAHVIASALAADKIVISLDNRARKIFQKVAEIHRPIGIVIWVNPIDLHDRVLEWLESEAAPESSLRLSPPLRS